MRGEVGTWSRWAAWIAMLATLGACNLDSAPAGGGGPTTAPAAASVVELHVRTIDLAPGAKLRFPVPKGLAVEAQHYDARLPPNKIRHIIHVGTVAGPLVIVDVWDTHPNRAAGPGRAALHTWFDEHLGFLVDENTRRSERAMTRARVPGILLEQPRSPQVHARAVAVFAHHGRVFRVTCVDAEDAAVRAIFDTVVTGFEPEAAP